MRSRIRSRPRHRRRAEYTSRERSQPRIHLYEVERFAQVVVGARVEPGDAFLDPVARGQHQHRRAVAARPRFPQHRKPAAVGKVQVQQHGIERLHAPKMARVACRRRGVDAVPGLREAEHIMSRSTASSSTTRIRMSHTFARAKSGAGQSVCAQRVWPGLHRSRDAQEGEKFE